MYRTRREFVKTALAGAVALPLAAKAFAADYSESPESLLPQSEPQLPANEYGLLEEFERVSFEYFWQEADPLTGLVRDRARANGGDTRALGSIAATGFGLTALCIGYERKYRPRPEILARVKRTLRFLAHKTPVVHGFLYHFVNIRNGNRAGDSEISPIDMAILVCGALTCREYFHDPAIQRDATALYERVDWPWALNGGNTFSLEWMPEFGFSRWRWDWYCESMMLYLLAMGSPTYPIPDTSWHAIRRPEMVYQNYRFVSVPAPLFVHQYSHAWFDFRGLKDQYADYYANSVIATQAHREFCLELSGRFPCYSGDVWGITASDSSTGYVAWGGPPMQGPIDGTLVPAAAAGSLPFTYQESMAVLRNLRGYYGRQIWKKYGFVDAFNPLTGWASSDVIGIDAGIGLLMAENARSEFVWKTFMRSREVRTAMDKAGFRSLQTPSTLYAASGVPAVAGL